MIHLINPELSFIERKTHGVNHIAYKTLNRPYLWQTCCGYEWNRDSISELTTRKLSIDEVCKRCANRASAQHAMATFG